MNSDCFRTAKMQFWVIVKPTAKTQLFYTIHLWILGHLLASQEDWAVSEESGPFMV